MTWKKVPVAARDWAGGCSPKTLYGAIKRGELKAARIGAGRNLLVCEAFVDEWLRASVRESPKQTIPSLPASAA
jgi:hypothetical protein